MEVELNDKLESKYKGLYIIGDGSGVTHSLSHASASGVYVAREIEAERWLLFSPNFVTSNDDSPFKMIC